MVEEKKYKDKKILLAKIKEGNRQLLRKLYEDYRDSFGKWTRKHYNCEEHLITEAYQTAFIAFYYLIKEENITSLKSNVKTYVFAIGKYILNDLLNKTDPKLLPAETKRLEEMDLSILKRYKDEANKSLINEFLNQIGEPCKSILELYYLKEYSFEDIAARMGYQNNQVAATKNLACMKQLRSLLNKKFE